MTAQLNDAENLSRIREILFGAEIESVENQVRLVKDEITQIVQRLEENGEVQRTGLQKFVNEKISQLESLLEENKAGQRVMHQKLQEELQTLQNRLTDSIDGVKNLIKESDERLKQMNDHSLELINILNERVDVLQQKVEVLDHSKVDKEKLASVFNRLADEVLTVDQDIRS